MGVFDFLVLFDYYRACFSLKIILKLFGYDGNKSKRYEQEDYVGSSDNVQKNEEGPSPCYSYSIVTFATSSTTKKMLCFCLFYYLLN